MEEVPRRRRALVAISDKVGPLLPVLGIRLHHLERGCQV